MTFIVANPLTDFEINHEFEKAYFEKTCSSKIPDVSFSVEKNEYEYHGNREINAIHCFEDNICWKGWLAGWKNCTSNLKIELPSQESIGSPKAYLLALKECAKAISESGVKTSLDTGYYLVYKSADQFMDFIKSEFEKEFPVPEYAIYVPQWNDYRLTSNKCDEKQKHDVSYYGDSWNTWKRGWKKAISRFEVKLPPQFEVPAGTTSFEIIEQAEKGLLEAGFKKV